jgi:hypothetical protein
MNLYNRAHTKQIFIMDPTPKDYLLWLEGVFIMSPTLKEHRDDVVLPHLNYYYNSISKLLQYYYNYYYSDTTVIVT